MATSSTSSTVRGTTGGEIFSVLKKHRPASLTCGRARSVRCDERDASRTRAQGFAFEVEAERERESERKGGPCVQEQAALLTAAMRLARMAETLTATCMEAEASPRMNTGFCSGKLSADIARAACGMSRATNAGAACIRELNASR